jgi:hypothetical protein
MPLGKWELLGALGLARRPKLVWRVIYRLCFLERSYGLRLGSGAASGIAGTAKVPGSNGKFRLQEPSSVEPDGVT